MQIRVTDDGVLWLLATATSKIFSVAGSGAQGCEVAVLEFRQIVISGKERHADGSPARRRWIGDLGREPPGKTMLLQQVFVEEEIKKPLPPLGDPTEPIMLTANFKQATNSST